jgi:SAM-dependent methyltransferase
MHVNGASERVATSTRCGLCGSDGGPWHVKYGYPILRCRSCGNAFVPASLVPTDLEGLYTPDYFEGGQETGYPSYLADAAILERNFSSRLDRIAKLGPSGRRLLDVGAAYGFLLKVARETGWDASGVEIAAECARQATINAGVPVVAGDFLDVSIAGAFDVIVMFDVIEHFRDPQRAIVLARDLLRPGGLLVIETGDLATPWAKLLGARWYFLDPPQHLFYFSKSGLTELLRKNGFGEVTVQRPGRLVSATNILFKLAAGAPPGPLRRVLSAAAKAAVPGHAYLNFGDCMLVAARRA